MGTRVVGHGGKSDYQRAREHKMCKFPVHSSAFGPIVTLKSSLTEARWV